MKIKPNFKRYLLNALVAVAFVIVTSLLSGNIRLSIIIPLSLIFCIASLALNMVCGCLGELALGHGGFMLVGGIIASFISQKIFEIVQTNNGYSIIQMYDIFYNKLTDTLHFEGYLFTELIQLIRPEPFIYKTSLIVLGIGILVGMIGSASAVKKYLKV